MKGTVMPAQRVRGFAINGWQFEYLLDRAAKLQARERLLSPAFNAHQSGGNGRASGNGAGDTSAGTTARRAQHATDAAAMPWTKLEPRELTPCPERLAVVLRSPARLYAIDPLQDPRWGEFVEKHPHASVFHSIPWLEALHRTYGYQPIAYTSSPPGRDLEDGIVFNRVKSWATGQRLVSLPFSDHCEPLVNHPSKLVFLLSSLEQQLRTGKWNSVELRPVHMLDGYVHLRPTGSYYLHSLDLSPDIHTLQSNLHGDSTQRKIRRAEREGLTYKEGRSESLLGDFYRLLLLTRRRHGLPPPPRTWHRNLIEYFGQPLKIRVAYKGTLPIASIMTIRHKDTLVYKYGCSDARFHQLGGMHLLLWSSIQEAKFEGLRSFDFGRSDRENTGLITFKNRWGAIPSLLKYYRYTSLPSTKTTTNGAGAEWRAIFARMAKPIFSRMPDSVISAAGSLLYKHIG